MARKNPRTYTQTRTHVRRWALSKSEMADPSNLTSKDELVARLQINTRFDSVETFDVVVYRDGKTTNRTTSGDIIPRYMRKMAQEMEVLIHPTGEETYVWRNVLLEPKTLVFRKFSDRGKWREWNKDMPLFALENKG